MTPDLPIVLDPALVWSLFTVVHANGSPMIDPRTGEPWRFTNTRAARQQAVALGVSVYHVAGIR
jgi:hypothetical protein